MVQRRWFCRGRELATVRIAQPGALIDLMPEEINRLRATTSQSGNAIAVGFGRTMATLSLPPTAIFRAAEDAALQAVVLKQRITNTEMRREAAHARRTAVLRTRSDD